MGHYFFNSSFQPPCSRVLSCDLPDEHPFGVSLVSTVNALDELSAQRSQMHTKMFSAHHRPLSALREVWEWPYLAAWDGIFMIYIGRTIPKKWQTSKRKPRVKSTSVLLLSCLITTVM